MNIKNKLLVSFLAIAVIGSCSRWDLTAAQAAAISGQPISSKLSEAGVVGDSRTASPGDIATGMVLDTRGAELRLNIRPCEGEPSVVIFHQPYNRSTRGQKNCAGRNATIEQIQQN